MINTHEPINLYFTDIKTVVGNNSALQHNCFYISPQFYSYSQTHYTSINYCMSELSTNFQILKIDFTTNFTFFELAQQNITGEQLYFWSAPIDVIEDYHDYLNRNDSSLSGYIFYNCTWPRFGSLCQYELNSSSEYFSDIHEYVYQNPEKSDDSRNKWSCYVHLTCNRSPGRRCLDWSDICDGKIDCLNDGVDEEHCWQLEINDCQEDEYKCYNGICLFKEFVTETSKGTWNCMRGNKKYPKPSTDNDDCKLSTQYEPYCDQTSCFETFLTSSCLKTDLVLMELFSIKQKHISDTCWSAVQCLARLREECVFSENLTEYVSMIEVHCPDFMFIPSVPILFDDIYLVYIRNQSRNVLIINIYTFIFVQKIHFMKIIFLIRRNSFSMI